MTAQWTEADAARASELASDENAFGIELELRLLLAGALAEIAWQREERRRDQIGARAAEEECERLRALLAERAR